MQFLVHVLGQLALFALVLAGGFALTMGVVAVLPRRRLPESMVIPVGEGIAGQRAREDDSAARL